MTALNKKLVRDLWRLRGQVAAIASVIGAGVAVLVMSLGALEALRETADAYYERSRFADVFATLKRAPERQARRIAALPGVQAVETRISKLALIDIEGFEEPVIGRLVSIPERGEPSLNRLTLRAGRFVAPGRPDEAVVSEAFAEGHGLVPGDRLRAIVNGHARTLEVVGIALSPEFVYAIGPGALMPDERRFGVIWMGREALAAAFDLDGAFNDVSVSLLRGAPPEAVIARLDALLASYGGVGAYDRSDQISNWFLMSEIDQLANLASILPVIFLAVAAFLTNMVLNRLIAIERSEIGLLKAFGYSNAAVGWHYAQLVIVIAAIGIALGFGLGGWFGRVVTGIYAEFYRFPFFFFRPSPAVFAVASVVSFGAALAGTARAVRRAVEMPPAEAMRPPAPALYARGGLSAVLERPFDQPTRMILRQIARWPARSFVTSFGVAMAVGLLVTAFQWTDAIDHMVENFFFQAQHQDVTLGLVEPQSSEITREIARLPGVLAAEPARFVPARLRAGPRSRRDAITGLRGDARLQPVYDARGAVVPLPPEGLLLCTKLAELLAVGPGDLVTVEVLEGRRPTREVPVAGVFETYIGTPAYMDIRALNRLLRERPTANVAHLQVDAAREAQLFAELKELPVVSAVMLRRAAVQKFHETMAESMLIFIGFFAAFSCMLAFGVTYNATRVALSERARELATLRVLGLSRLEISYILLGEVALLALIGLPAGCAVGFAIAGLIAERFETELYRVPLVIDPSTFGLAVAITLAATVISAALVRRRLDRLDLIAVLKTRE
ncbi:MAG: ABC transporter permease [Deltaproteobacteria bacterium]|nr:MAG: ABC transporter permease [Deltaproteobacteria bacterium]